MSVSRRVVAIASGLGLGAVGIVVLMGTSAATAQLSAAADWPMNEPSNASAMVDHGPFGLDGAIGDEVQPGGGHYTFTWPFGTQPGELTPSDDRIVIVDDDDVLDPELEDYEIEFTYRTNQNYGNVLQKGQNTTAGGYFKIEQPFGFATCLFKDEAGVQKAIAAQTSTSDGEWHTIRCQLDRSTGPNGTLRLYVDGQLDQINTLDERVGNVNNDWPFVIGGKYQCNQNTVTCDYFRGDVRNVIIRRGALPSPSTTTTTVASGPPAPGVIDAATATALAVRGERTQLD